MDLRPGYKQTEAGVIPEPWVALPLGDIASITAGGTPSRASAKYWNGDIPWVTTSEVDFCTVSRADQFITKEGLDSSAAKLLPRGTLLMALYGQGKTRGKVAILGIDAATNQACAAIALRSDISREFVFHALVGQYDRIRSLSNTGNQENLNGSLVRSIVIPLPPATEQRAIAAALRDVDELLGGLDRLITKKRELKQATMQQLLTGRTRLPGFGVEWEVRRISDVASPVSEKNIAGEKLPVLTCSKHLGFVDSLGFFKNQVFSKDLSAYKVIRRGEIGYPANHVEEGSIGLQDIYDVALVSPIYVVFKVSERICSFFLHRLLKLDSYRQRFKTATTSSVDRRGSLRWPAFSEITVRVPSTKEEQSAIAAVLSDMDAELSVLEARRDKTRALKQAMMQELLTGKTRLVEAPSNVIAVDFAAMSKSAAAQQQPAAKPHNWAINEAVVVSMLVKQFGSEQYPLGRKRCTKLAYLLHRHVEHVAEGYLKKAAGPYNPAVKYKGPEGIAQKNGYIRAHASGKFSGFVAAQKIAQAEDYFEKWYGLDVLAWLEQFRFSSNDELELLATVDMAAEDLRRANALVDVAAVRAVIHGHPEWEAKLERDAFSEVNIARAIHRASELFPVG
jgi:type I restriction enzyme, S subunit